MTEIFRKKTGHFSYLNKDNILVGIPVWLIKEMNSNYAIQMQYDKLIFNSIIREFERGDNLVVDVILIDKESVRRERGGARWFLQDDRFYNKVTITGDIENLAELLQKFERIKSPAFTKSKDLEELKVDYILKELKK